VDQLCWHKFNPDLLSTASGDKTVKVWDVRHQKCSNTILTKGKLKTCIVYFNSTEICCLFEGENINITWSPDGHTIAVGNKEDLITFIDMRILKPISEQQFNFEVNEMSWNNENDLFFLTNGLGCVYVLR
jgi:THO complex subunit 3